MCPKQTCRNKNYCIQKSYPLMPNTRLYCVPGRSSRYDCVSCFDFENGEEKDFVRRGQAWDLCNPPPKASAFFGLKVVFHKKIFNSTWYITSRMRSHLNLHNLTQPSKDRLRSDIWVSRDSKPWNRARGNNFFWRSLRLETPDPKKGVILRHR